MNTKVQDFITETLAYIRPELVILGGDLCTGTLETSEMEIHELCELFRSSGTYFALTFGNHDSESGMINEKILTLYQKYGGEYCLAADPFPEISGCGNHVLPVFSSDMSEVIFNLYLLDSGDYVQTDDGEIHYSSVKADQVRWLQDVYDRKCPSFVFQHI
ncbi:MAG: metallophosphoesterase, partial [Spirochaetia bacterium]|nr:metallophosphoesterase [Spirochaetia bacterium]